MPKFVVHIGYTIDEIEAAQYTIADGFLHFLDEDDNLLASFAAAQVSRVERAGVVTEGGRVPMRPRPSETN
jgi:hypothetical protein